MYCNKSNTAANPRRKKMPTNEQLAQNIANSIRQHRGRTIEFYQAPVGVGARVAVILAGGS